MPNEQSASLDPALLRPNSMAVWRARYLRRDPESGECIEEPQDLLDRVAGTVASVEERYGASPERAREVRDAFFGLMASGRFLPNSPTLMNAGGKLGLLNACFVLPIEDSIEGIFDTLKNAALIQKAGGGTGFDFSRLRPAGDAVLSSGGKTTGPLSFLRVYSEATHAIQQGAFRRGANMGVLKVTHPDVIEFIRAKDTLDSLLNYNLSVAVTDEYMRRVIDAPDTVHVVTNPRTGRSYPLPRKDRPGEVWRAGEVFDLIAKRAWATGEPGIIFLDRINEDNVTPHLGRIEATNPCSEQPLLPYESCTLGSVNVARFVKAHPPVSWSSSPDELVDWEGLRGAVHTAVRFLDNVLDASLYPVAAIQAASLANRKIGLGLMGFADLLFTLGIGYDSERAVAFGERLMTWINDESHRASEQLAVERGPFPNWAQSLWNTRDSREQRNASVTTIAPTGTISILAGASGGIEPLFALAFERHVLDGRRLVEVSEVFRRTANEMRFYSDELLQRILRGTPLREMPDVPKKAQEVFVTARDIAPTWHVRMQAAFQHHCDAAISKTINFPEEATPEEVRAAFLAAFELRLKGMTIYRDGSRPAQPMATAPRPQAAAGGVRDQHAASAKCPECDCDLTFQEGCTTCYACGYSRC